mgnify:CR=1 FL=1
MGRDDDLVYIRESLASLIESVGEVTTSQARQDALATGLKEDVRALAATVNGSGDSDGLRMRVRLLEEAQARAAKPERSGAHDALAVVEKARADAAKDKWSTALAVAKAVGPAIGGILAALAAHVAWK